MIGVLAHGEAVVATVAGIRARLVDEPPGNPRRGKEQRMSDQ